jgi:hypothetical protein
MPASQVFISYRRDDTAGWAGRLSSDLRVRLGQDARVFMDVDGIPPGEDFARYIDEAVGKCDAVVALIGRHWSDAKDAQGHRRLDEADDFVRLEISSALQRGIRVIPLLVDGAVLPDPAELPPDLEPLLDRQAIRVDNTTWESSVGKLATSLIPEDPPKLVVSATRIEFGDVTMGGAWPRRTVQIRNAGGGDLGLSATTSDSWIVLHNRQDALDILIDTSHSGEYVGVVHVRSAGGSAAIEVHATIQDHSAPVAPPPQQFTAAAAPAAPPPRQMPAPAPAYTPAPQPFAPAPQQWATPPAHAAGVPQRMSVPTNMVWAVLTTLFCFPPTGIVAIVYASKVSGLLSAGNYAGAVEASKKAKMWSIISVVAFVCFLFIYAAGMESGSDF